MTTTHTFHYRGYEIVAQRQWASWYASIYATRAGLPLMWRSTLRTLAPGKEAAVAEAVRSIDEVLARMIGWGTDGLMHTPSAKGGPQHVGCAERCRHKRLAR